MIIQTFIDINSSECPEYSNENDAHSCSCNNDLEINKAKMKLWHE